MSARAFVVCAAALVLGLPAAASAAAAPAPSRAPGDASPAATRPAAAPASAPAGMPAVVATAARTDVSLGEPFALELRASGPAGCTFAFAESFAGDSLELSSVSPAKGDSPALHRYQAAVFGLGEARVPPIPVRYRLADGTQGEIATAPIPLRVRSLLAKGDEGRKLADVRAPLRLAVGRAFWIASAVLALLLAALGVAIARRRRAEAPAAPAAPPIAPEEEARRALEALAASGRLGRAEYRPFYIELTGIAKRYLERKLGAPFVEMTTAEMLAHFRQSPHTEMGPFLRDLSGAADQIKFARGSGVSEEAERHLASVRALVDGLEARLRPAAEGGATA